MASSNIPTILVIVVALIAGLGGFLRGPLNQRLELFGFYRPLESVEIIHGSKPEFVPGTINCEDLHYHEPSGLIFGAAEKDPNARKQYFPPLGNFQNPEAVGQGKLFTLDPHTNKRTDLALENFSGKFLSHGIDIYTPPNDPDTVYIFAVNHVPSANSPGAAAASQVELFKHTLGSSTAQHLRSIIHPLIRTPNDLLALNAHEFYVTNDHFYRDGVIRMLEDFGIDLTAWSDIIHIKLASLESSDGTAGVVAQKAIDGVHNPNGLGHGSTESEILLGRAAAGTMEIMHLHASNRTLEKRRSVSVSTTIDNPAYFRDPYVKQSGGRDASGYLNAGLVRAIDLPHKDQYPVAVWLTGTGEGAENRLIFQDDGKVMNTASSAIIVAIDPEENGGKKEGWLFVTGFFSEGVVRTKIEL